MGIVSYLVDEERRELFCLGKGFAPIEGVDGCTQLAWKLDDRYDVDLFLEQGYHRAPDPEVAQALLDWLQRASVGPKPITNDVAPEWDDGDEGDGYSCFKVTGAVHPSWLR